MKKLATKLLVCSLTCSLLVSGYQASALPSTYNLDDLSKLLSSIEDTSEDYGSTASVTLSNDDLKNIIEKSVAKSVDKSVEKSMEKAALKVARDPKSVQNLVNESKKTSKGSALWKIVTFPFSAAWNVVKSVVVLALALALPVGGTYAFAPSSREAIKTDLNNLLNTLKNSNSANKIVVLAKSAYSYLTEKLQNIFSPTEEATTKQSSDSNDDETEETDESTESSSQEITNNTEADEFSQKEKITPIVTE